VDPPGAMKWTLVGLMAGSLLIPLVGIPLVQLIGG